MPTAEGLAVLARPSVVGSDLRPRVTVVKGLRTPDAGRGHPAILIVECLPAFPVPGVHTRLVPGVRVDGITWADPGLSVDLVPHDCAEVHTLSRGPDAKPLFGPKVVCEPEVCGCLFGRLAISGTVDVKSCRRPPVANVAWRYGRVRGFAFRSSFVVFAPQLVGGHLRGRRCFAG